MLMLGNSFERRALHPSEQLEQTVTGKCQIKSYDYTSQKNDCLPMQVEQGVNTGLGANRFSKVLGRDFKSSALTFWAILTPYQRIVYLWQLDSMNTCIRHVTLHFRFRHGAKLRSITEIAPKSPFLCAKRSPFRYWFRADTNRLRPGSDAGLFMSRT